MKTAPQVHPFFSIIIPTLNEEKYLPQLLKDLTQQTFKQFEVIVIDGHSQDLTVEKATTFKQLLPLQTKIVKKRNVSFQRNQGGKLAKGQWLIFMDADNRLPNYFLEGVKYQLNKRPQVDLFSCWAAIKENNPNYKLIINAANLSLELNRVFNYPSVYGSLFGIRGNIFAKSKFDENQLVAEDFLLAQELVKRGYHFELFKDPRHYYSFRRLEKEGLLKTAKTLALVQLHYLQGKDFKDKNYGYVMEGGKYYQEQSNLETNLAPLLRIQEHLKKASKKQLQQAREIFQNLKGQLNEDLDHNED